MSTTVMPTTVKIDAVGAAPLQCFILVGADEVVVASGADDLMTAAHDGKSLGRVAWDLPPGMHLASSTRSTLIGAVQEAVLRASQ